MPPLELYWSLGGALSTSWILIGDSLQVIRGQGKGVRGPEIPDAVLSEIVLFRGRPNGRLGSGLGGRRFWRGLNRFRWD
jgi:hypothetical protein